MKIKELVEIISTLTDLNRVLNEGIDLNKNSNIIYLQKEYISLLQKSVKKHIISLSELLPDADIDKSKFLIIGK